MIDRLNDGETLILNVGGDKHEVQPETLLRFPETKLAHKSEISEHYRQKTGDYFFDRHPRVFAEVLNYYRTGRLHIPQDVCISVFIEEIAYWGINVLALEDCCWLEYSEHQDKLASIKKIQMKGSHNRQKEGLSAREFLWNIIDDPRSNFMAKIYAGVNVLIILLSLFVLCALTHPEFKVQMGPEDYANYYQVSESTLAKDWGWDYVEGTPYEKWYINMFKEELTHLNDNAIEENPKNNLTDGEEPDNPKQPKSSLGQKRTKRNLKVLYTELRPSDGYLEFEKISGPQSWKDHNSEYGHIFIHKKSIAYHTREIKRLQKFPGDETLVRNRREIVNVTTNATTPKYPRLASLHHPHPALMYLDLTCFSFFLMDFILRTLSCPRKIKFVQSFLTWTDFLANLTFAMEFILHKSFPKEMYQQTVIDLMGVLKMLRIFRIFRLFQYNKGLRVLLFTFQSSLKEILLLILFLGTGVLLFASLIFYAENGEGAFSSIPDACWWATVTITTVGFGELAPSTSLGRIVGTLCAISGVLMVGFTVPVIANKFMLFYQFLSAERSSPNKVQVAPSGGKWEL